MTLSQSTRQQDRKSLYTKICTRFADLMGWISKGQKNKPICKS